jgi:hypothetical protein
MFKEVHEGSSSIKESKLDIPFFIKLDKFKKSDGEEVTEKFSNFLNSGAIDF